MYGWTDLNGTLQQTPITPEMTLQADLGAGVTVINHGVGGSTSDNAVNGTGSYTAPLATRLQTINAQIVIANWAINDSRLITTSDDYGSLMAFVNTVRAAGRTPVLEEPNPVCWGLSDLDPYVAIMRTVAQQQNVLLIAQYDYISSLDWKPMLPDCIHPNAALYKIKGDREAAAISELVKSMR
jgi:acyl-CoA thioesterase I